MTEQLSREQIEQLRDCLCNESGMYDADEANILCDMAIRALSPQREAVAWRYKPAYGNSWVLITQELGIDAHSYACGQRAEPLYAPPPAPSAEVVEALREALKCLEDYEENMSPASKPWKDLCSVIDRSKALLAQLP